MDETDKLVQVAISEMNEIRDELNIHDEKLKDVQIKINSNRSLINENTYKIQQLKMSLAIKKFIYLLFTIFLIFFFVYLYIENCIKLSKLKNILQKKIFNKL